MLPASLKVEAASGSLLPDYSILLDIIYSLLIVFNKKIILDTKTLPYREVTNIYQRAGRNRSQVELTGSTTQPRSILDDAAGDRQTIEKKAFDTISDVLPGEKPDSKTLAAKKTGVLPGNEVQKLLKGPFGR